MVHLVVLEYRIGKNIKLATAFGKSAAPLEAALDPIMASDSPTSRTRKFLFPTPSLFYEQPVRFLLAKLRTFERSDIPVGS